MPLPQSHNVSKPKVLLFFRRYASSFTAYSWIFGRCGRIEVHTMAPETHPIRHSKWVDQHLVFESDGELVERLVAALEEGGYDALICLDEPAREIVLEHRDHPTLKPYLPFAEGSPLFEAAVNKVKFQQWCAELGFDSPKSFYCSTREEVQNAVAKFDYPFVLKGAHGAGGQQVHIVENEKTLASLLHDVEGSPGEEWIVQEYLTGAVGTTIFVARGGRLYAHCSVKNRVCMYGGIGPSAICKFVVDPEFERIAQAMAEHVDGLTGVDWMQHEDGRYLLIDPHLGRATPNAVIAHMDGVDFGDAMYRALSGQAPSVPVPQNSGKKVWLMPKSLNLIFEGRLGAALRVANPFSRNVRVFFAGKREWRLFAALTFEVLSGNLRVLLGRIRRNMFQSKTSDRVEPDISNEG